MRYTSVEQVERAQDRLDRAYVDGGTLTHQQYLDQCDELEAWDMVLDALAHASSTKEDRSTVLADFQECFEVHRDRGEVASARIYGIAVKLLEDGDV